MGTEVKEKVEIKKSRKRGKYLRLLVPTKIYSQIVGHRNTRMIGKNTIEQAGINLIENGIAFLEQQETAKA